MIRAALVCALCTGMALSQCAPSTPSPYNTSYAPSGNGNGNNGSSNVNNQGTSSSINGLCKSVKTIPRPPNEIFKAQPLYQYMFANIARYNRLDNTCITLFPLPGNTGSYRLYNTLVYTDGSYAIRSYIIKSFATGANLWSYTARGFINYNLGYIGCGSYIRYTCPLYGDAVQPAFMAFGPGFGPIGNGTGKLTDDCVQKAQSLARENSLDIGDYYLLPYKLPTRCVFQHVCLPKGNPLYCEQDNTCKGGQKEQN